MSRLVLLVLALSLLGCRHPTPEQCDKLCWRYNELHFWADFDKEAAGLAPDARAKLRADREKAWADIKTRKFDPGLENCERECHHSADPDQADCVAKATTAKAAEDCLK